ncbi:MAG: serine/threonine-protein phosphatase [Azoarcus sp.]|jgi:serine/threonine protein phosphatase PrpC|nr:serine/threonine-protein phosphatase [Azoarcus sp.]
MMRLSVAHRSECGGRKANEDAVGFCANETQGCFVLADGTGGHEGGALASDTVVRQVLAHFSAAPQVDGDSAGTLMTVAREALSDVRKLHPQFPEMNTTIATLVLNAESRLAYWNSIGDSRIYLFRNGRARSLTTDHSILQSMIDAGFFTGDLRGNSRRNMLYAAVGSEEVPERAIHSEPFALQPGDVFLLCSDGLWENIDEEIMEEILLRSETPEQWIDDMMKAVPNPCAPDQDNFSALSVWIGEHETATTRRIPAENPTQE